MAKAAKNFTAISFINKLKFAQIRKCRYVIKKSFGAIGFTLEPGGWHH